MGYYQVQDRQLVPCPVNAVWQGPENFFPVGTSIFNYCLLPAPVLEAAGWKSAIVEDERPAYDEGSQELAAYYEDCGTYIACRWEIAERPEEGSAEKDEALKLLGVEV